MVVGAGGLSVIPSAARNLRCSSNGNRLLAASLLGMTGCSNQIDDGEQDDPNEIHEVPVQADHLDTAMIGLRVLPTKRFLCHEDHAQHTNGHVEAVETRH